MYGYGGYFGIFWIVIGILLIIAFSLGIVWLIKNLNKKEKKRK